MTVAHPSAFPYPSDIQKTETMLVETEPPKQSYPVTDEDFTKLWNRVAQMDRAVLELISEYRRMQEELSDAIDKLTAKTVLISTMESNIRILQENNRLLQKQLDEQDDRINWLET